MEKKKRRFPDTYVIIFAVICLAAILTYVIPAGTYENVVNEATGQSAIDPMSFHNIEGNPTTLMEFLTAIPRGLVKNADTIFLLVLVGGFIQVIMDTGALDRSLTTLMRKLGTKDLILIPIVMLVMAFLGATGVVVNAVLGFVPLGLFLAKKLRTDPLVGIAITFVANYSGFAASPMGVSTLQLAQKLSGVKELAHFGFRTVAFIVFMALIIAYTMVYAIRVRKDATKSIVYGFTWDDDANDNGDGKMSAKDLIVSIALIVGIAIFAYGVHEFSWKTNTQPAIMMVVAIFAAILFKIHPNDMVKSFVNGCKKMTYSTILIGFAGAVSLVLTDAGIIHTIIHALAAPMNQLGGYLGGVFLFIFNNIVNIFIPSGSGQATVVIPILAPLCEVCNISKEVMICAYKYGDGFSNMIFPTMSVMFGTIGIAKVSYQKWLKFMLPLFGLICVVCIAVLFIGTAIGI